MTKLLTTKDMTELFQVSEMTIVRWKRKGMPFLDLGYRVHRFEFDKVMQWVKTKK